MAQPRKLLGAFLAAVLLAAGGGLAAAAPAGAQADDGELRPMIFVHGFLGSGQQFESQALRFASNGYPEDLIEMFEHDSLSFPGSQAEVFARLDTLIADLQSSSGSEQVNLLGHSQGTGLVQGYLNSSAERAADVAQYVNLDGGPGGTVPATVETLAVWGEGDPARQLPGATNVQFAEQGHTEVVNSPETFAAIYEHFTGEEPEFGEVVREPADEIEVSGRAIFFPQNTGATGGVLNIYEVDGETGLRLDDEPVATFEPSADGNWGPFDADGDAYYEFAVTRDDLTHHIFTQRFVRSTRWARLLTSEPDGLANSFWEFSDDHENLVVFRNKEWWADQGGASDALTVNGESVLNAANSPRTNRTIAIFLHDFGLDRRSDIATPVSPTGIPFLTGVDLFIPAADPPTGTVAVEAEPRLGDGPEAVCVPNYSSTRHRVSVQLNSYHHLLDAEGASAEGHAAPECGPAPVPPVVPPVVPPPAVPIPGEPDFSG